MKTTLALAAFAAFALTAAPTLAAHSQATIFSCRYHRKPQPASGISISNNTQ